MRRTMILLCALMLLIPWLLSAQQAVPNELLVQFKAGATAADKGRALGRAGAVVTRQVVPASQRTDGKGDLVLVKHPDGPPGQAKKNIEDDAAVEFAEPNWIYQHQQQCTPNDTYFQSGQLWGMYGSDKTKTCQQNQYGSNAAAAWTAAIPAAGDPKISVGVIDEGIQYYHPDLAANVSTTYGYDFYNHDATIYDGSTSGTSTVDAHGTHVAGTIGAVGNNGKGVAGVNWAVTIISAKFLGPRGGTTAGAVEAVNYLTNLKTDPKTKLNIVATNNSWGGGGYSSSLYNAISAAGDAGILFIAAAGNSGWNLDRKASYPASYNLWNVIAVGALDSSGNPARWSNYGVKTVELFAPGVGIISTVPVDIYASYSGTSMATPHVTGAVALYAAAKGWYTATTVDQAKLIKTALLTSTAATQSLATKCITGGRLDVAAMLTK